MHSWIGIQLSMLFFVVCLSGTIAVFSHELDWLFNPQIRVRPTQKFASKNEIVKKIRDKYPNHYMAYWARPAESYIADVVYLVDKERHRKILFINPYTGAIQGFIPSSLTISRFFRDLHYYLFIPFQIGHFTVLLFGFLLLGSLVSGWQILSNKRKQFKNFRKQKKAIADLKNFHKTFGLWVIPFVLLFSLTGIWYFVERADVFSVSKYIRDVPVKKTSITKSTQRRFCYIIDYDRCIAIAKQNIPGFKFGTMLIPLKETQPLELRGKSGVPLVRYRANRVVIDPNNYELLKLQNAKNINPLRTINNIVDPLHFGNFGGLYTKPIWFIFGLMISFLVASGTLIYIKRTQRKTLRYNFKFLNWAGLCVLLFFMYQKLIFYYKAGYKMILMISFIWFFFILLFYTVYHKLYKKVLLKKID